MEVTLNISKSFRAATRCCFAREVLRRISEETKWRIFEPFYTTKFTGRGLGMSVVLDIIKSHGGALQLFSQPDH